MPSINDIFSRTYPDKLKGLDMPYDFRAAVPGVQIDSYKGPYGEWGYVDRKLGPRTMYINQNMRPKEEAPQVLSHEFEHVLQNEAGKRYTGTPNGYDNTVLNELYSIGRKTGGWGNAVDGGRSKGAYLHTALEESLKNSAIDKTIPKYFMEKYNYPIKYFGDMRAGEYSLREQFAELSAAEQYLKKDLTKDSFIQQRVFNNNKNLISLYKATTGLRTNRLDARDLPPMDTGPFTPSGTLQKIFGN